jgi:hypothetical protein
LQARERRVAISNPDRVVLICDRARILARSNISVLYAIGDLQFELGVNEKFL